MLRYMSPAAAVLVVVNVAMFLLGLVLPRGEEKLLTLGAFWFPTHANFGPWQAVTYMFLHANFSHLFFNMFALVSFGTILEREWGAVRFVTFYFLCGVGAGLIQEAVNWHQYKGLHDQLVAAGMTPSSISSLLATRQDLEGCQVRRPWLR